MLRHLRLERPLACIDTETTGLVEDGGRIVEIAIVTVRQRRGIVAGSYRVDPGTEIPESASRIHGITNADIDGCPTFSELLAVLSDALADSDIAGFNWHRFDSRIIDDERRRAGLVALDLRGRHVLDVMEVFHRFLPTGPYGRPRRGTGTLDACCAKYLGGSVPAAHGALRDCLAALWCLDAMIAAERLPDTVPGLLEWLAAGTDRQLRQPMREQDVPQGAIQQPLIPGLHAPPRPWGPEARWPRDRGDGGRRA